MDRTFVRPYVRGNKLRSFFYILLSVLYGIVASGSILGFLGLFTFPLVLLLSTGLAALVFYLLVKEGMRSIPSISKNGSVFNFGPDTLSALAGALIFVSLVLIPLVRWPLTPISNPLTWDAGLYHFPKAAEMISTGSAWDLTIAYGEYPFGYESLVAFALLLNHAGLFIGSAHALIALFLYLTLILILADRLQFPVGIIALLTSVLILSYRFVPAFDSNIWSILWSQLTLIGKNDLFLAASFMGIFFFTPGAREAPLQPIGLAVASMLALSIKPTAGLVILSAWGIFFYFAAKSGRISKLKYRLLPAVLIMVPGGLWIIRNILNQGALFSQEVLDLSKWSIAGNLLNPFFYNYIPPHLLIALAILIVSAVFSIRGITRRVDVLFAFVFLLAFILSPASGFSGSSTERTQIAWRFAVALLLVLYILMTEILDHFAARPLEKWQARRGVRWVIPILSVLLCTWGIWSQQSLLQTNVKRTVLLRDQFDHPVGSQGYFSAYDYVQKNVRNSTVIVENGLPYFLYDPGFTNSVTRSKPADFIVFIKFPNPDFSAFASRIDTPSWEQEFELVYEDSQGRVYERR